MNLLIIFSNYLFNVCMFLVQCKLLLFTPNTGKYLSYFIDQFSQKVINFTDIFKESFFSFFEFLYACSFPVLFIFVLNSSFCLRLQVCFDFFFYLKAEYYSIGFRTTFSKIIICRYAFFSKHCFSWEASISLLIPYLIVLSITEGIDISNYNYEFANFFFKTMRLCLTFKTIVSCTHMQDCSFC